MKYILSTLFIVSTLTAIAQETRIAHGAYGKDYIFTREKRFPELGEAWRDPSGMIWGDIVKDTDGTVYRLEQRQASSYCKSINAKLPSREDFIRLREYLGATSNTLNEYKAQVLPNLYLGGNSERSVVSAFYWSSTVYHPAYPNEVSTFSGITGAIKDDDNRNYGFLRSFRCVLQLNKN